MTAVIQRVSRASVSVGDTITGQIRTGLLILLGVAKDDTKTQADYLVDKIAALRIFADSEGKMNLSVRDVGGALLVVSQFTLLGDCSRGRRPSFDAAAPPSLAQRLYDYFVARCAETGLHVQTGVFQAHMRVELENEGPVTFVLQSASLAVDK